MRVRRAAVPVRLSLQIRLSRVPEEPSVSVVDQPAWLVTGVVRRSLLRAVLVLGGACAVTVIGWLFCAGSANADVLPSVPGVPSALSAVSSDVSAVVPTKVGSLSTPDLHAVATQVRHTVTGVGERVAPSVVPAAALVPHTDLVPLAVHVVQIGPQRAGQPAAAKPATAHPSAHTARRVGPAPSRARQPFVAQHRQVSDSRVSYGATPLPGPAGSSPSPVDVDHHSPALPPLQPAGSSDSSAHGAGGVAGGPGGAQIPFTHVLGDGLTMAGTSSTPRLAAGPGRQPGTSPD
jgi:hypothetical protein